MAFFSGLHFFIYLFILLLPAVFLGLSGKRLGVYRTLLTGVFIFLIYRENMRQLLYLAAYSIFSLYLVIIYAWLRRHFGRNRFLYFHAVLFALMPLAFCKFALFRGNSAFGFLGISYITFRVVQVIIETYDGVITEISTVRFLNFLLFFPTLSSGPIDRSRRFEQDWNTIYTRSEYAELLGTGLHRIALGLLYKVVLSAICYRLLEKYFSDIHTPLQVAGYAYCYGIYMFFDFAGYSALAVGTSYILGIRVPDNFNKPFLAIDIKDFWNRWHITLSTWFRDFVFTRFTMDSMRAKRFGSRLECACAAFIVNMGIMGLWHGLEAHYIAYGLYHGVILALTEVYQKKSKFYKANKNRKWYRVCTWFVTLNIVMFGFLIFSPFFLEHGGNVLKEISRTAGVEQVGANGYTYTTQREGNGFSYVVIQLYNPRTKKYSSIHSASGGKHAGEYTHAEEDGVYIINLRGNSNLADEYIQYEAKLENGATYSWEYTIDDFSSKKITVHNFSFKKRGKLI